jgi:putative spermidine/putrescine transport system permease protein
MESATVRWTMRIFAWIVLAALFMPLVIVIIYAFNISNIPSWPPQLFTVHWFAVAWQDPTLKGALANSLVAGVFATILSLLLGSLAAFGLHRFRFFGREAISFLLVLPIALPGIVTALALSAMVDSVPFIRFGIQAIIVGHATFCVVVVYNNVIARLRRTAPSTIEASMDLGADPVQTFRYVTFPQIRSALIAGGLLAFGLSFDEIVVTLYLAGSKLTLPLWIYNNIQRPVNIGAVYVVGSVVLLISIIPVYIAQRLAGGESLTPGRMGGTAMPTAGAGAVG